MKGSVLMAKFWVDPGHGTVIDGILDTGAVGSGGTKECDICFMVANLVSEYLKEAGHEVKQSNQKTQKINDRTAAANAWPADYFVSIHCNFYEDKSVTGTETYIYAKGGMAEKLAKSVNDSLSAAIASKNRGVKVESSLGVLRLTNMPAILVELDFISSPAVEANMNDSAWRDRAAKAIAKGIFKIAGGSLPEDKMDNTPSPWAKDAVNWAIENGIIFGDEKGDYKLHANIDKETFCVMLKRYFDKFN